MPHAEPAPEQSPEAPCSDLQQPIATDSNPLQPDPAAPLTKPEVCKLLGKSERTVNTYMADGRLAFRLINGKAHFDPAVVEGLKADLETPVVRGVAAPILPALAVSQKSDNGQTGSNGNGALARIVSTIDPEAARSVAEAFAVALRDGLRPQPPPALEAWKTLKEAAEYSGLPPRWLVKQARAGAPWAMNVGTEKTPDWRFRIEGGAR